MPTILQKVSLKSAVALGGGPVAWAQALCTAVLWKVLAIRNVSDGLEVLSALHMGWCEVAICVGPSPSTNVQP